MQVYRSVREDESHPVVTSRELSHLRAYLEPHQRGRGLTLLRIGVVMYQTSLTKGQELVAERMVREFRRQGYDAFLITSIYEDWEPALPIEEVTDRGGFVHLYDDRMRILIMNVDSYTRD